MPPEEGGVGKDLAMQICTRNGLHGMTSWQLMLYLVVQGQGRNSSGLETDVTRRSMEDIGSSTGSRSSNYH